MRVVDRRWWAREDASTGGDEAPARKPTYVEELERQLAEKDKHLAGVLEDHRRALAEFEEARVRIRRDVGREVERGRRFMLAELLDVVDNLDRALAAAGEEAGGSESFSQFVRGVELVRDQFLSKLQGFGVTRVAALGLAFDASRHEAVTTTPVADPAHDGVIVAVVKEGYAVGDEMLRPAAVVVGKA